MPNLLERVEELHRRVTELEQRVPKPGDRKVVFGSFEPRQFVSASEFATPPPCDSLPALAWKERAERAEGKLSDAHGLAVELRHAFASGRDVDSLNLAHNLVDFLARARVAKAGP